MGNIRWIWLLICDKKPYVVQVLSHFFVYYGYVPWYSVLPMCPVLLLAPSQGECAEIYVPLKGGGGGWGGKFILHVFLIPTWYGIAFLSYRDTAINDEVAKLRSMFAAQEHWLFKGCFKVTQPRWHDPSILNVISELSWHLNLFLSVWQWKCQYIF